MKLQVTTIFGNEWNMTFKTRNSEVGWHISMLVNGYALRLTANGWGYDMLGTCFAKWLGRYFQEDLAKLDPQDYYGMLKDHSDNRVYLSGACGLDCMVRVAEAIGLNVQIFN
jgi:hypothetical protein